MYHYLFTNDLRISNLEEFLIDAGKCFVEDRVPSANENKNANNNMNTLGFYFNLTKDSNCAKYCANRNIRPVILNFIKKFQFPNPRTAESINDSMNDNITLAPLRIIIQVLYFMNNINKEEAYLSDEEIASYIFFNEKIAKSKSQDILSLAKDIIEGRKNNVVLMPLEDEILNNNGFYWKQCKRQLREMIKILTWSGCAIKDNNGNIKLHNDNLNMQNKAELFDILVYSNFWIPDKDKDMNENKKSYQDYMDMEQIEIEESTNIENKIEKYSKEKFLEEVFITEEKYDSIVNVLNKKKNIILEGAPGVGKTYMAKRLVYSLIGEKDKNRIEFIQFHQSYSYEDFVEGYRPNDNGFSLEKGLFYSFCKRAEKNKEKDFYLIIDEINRGNLSKIFGELLMLIENGKREETLSLVYSHEKFSVPNNLYIIGLMNTADRSLAIIDYALRRRFSFIRIEPAFSNEKFKENFLKGFNGEFKDIITLIEKLNEYIEEDKSLGAGFKIGHSYFCNIKNGTKQDIKNIIQYEIVPLLEEYWFDDEETLEMWKNTLNGVTND